MYGLFGKFAVYLSSKPKRGSPLEGTYSGSFIIGSLESLSSLFKASLKSLSSASVGFLPSISSNCYSYDLSTWSSWYLSINPSSCKSFRKSSTSSGVGSRSKISFKSATTSFTRLWSTFLIFVPFEFFCWFFVFSSKYFSISSGVGSLPSFS